MTVIEQIHNEFYSASDELLQAAKNVNAKPEKAKTLKRLGFVQAKEVSENVDAEWLAYNADLVNYYAFHYPFNKFITKGQVTQICKRYNLVCGPVSIYTGTVPDEKLKQIAGFKLRKQDVIKEHQSRFSKIRVWEPRDDSNWLVDIIVRLFGYCPPLVIPLATCYHHRYVAPELMICAPEKEMKITHWGMRFGEDGFIEHIPDPVVLQPVKGGYLILAAWGEEAADVNVVNEKMN